MGLALSELFRDGPVLDVGTGTGRVTGELYRDPQLHLVGIDVALGMLRHAAEKGATRLVRGDARRLPFRDRAFASAMSTHLLHLVRDWPAVLSEIGRVSRLRYASVLERETVQPDLEGAYKSALEAAGGSAGHPGLSDRDLGEQLAPDRRISIPPLDYELPSAEVLALLEQMAYRWQWGVPADLHADLMERVRAIRPGTVTHVHLECEIAVWEVSRIREFAAAATDRGPSSGTTR